MKEVTYRVEKNFGSELRPNWCAVEVGTDFDELVELLEDEAEYEHVTLYERPLRMVRREVTETILKRPRKWADEKGIVIRDPDGWRSEVFSYPPRSFEDPISEDEFDIRSTWSLLFKAHECARV